MHATIPKGVVGGFEFSVLQRNLKELARKAMEVCFRVLKESNKVGSTATVVRNSVLIISHITFRDCRVHIFSDNLSRNSCIHNRQSNKQVFFSLDFADILLQMGAEPVQMRLHFFDSAIIANSKLDHSISKP